MLAYELWETQSGNLMASFESEAEALRAIVARARRHGPASVDSIALVQVNDADEDGEMVTVASGEDLLVRAEQAPSSGPQQRRTA